MATTNTSLYGNQIGAGASPIYPSVMDVGAKLHQVRIETTVAALGATGDILNLIRLPASAKVSPQHSRITCESPGTTVTLKVGDASDDDRYMASNALGGSARDILFSSSPGVDAYVNALVGAGNEIITLTSITIGTPTTTAKVVIVLGYFME